MEHSSARWRKSLTPRSEDVVGKAPDLLGISNSQRARDSISKCLEAVNLEDHLIVIVRQTTALRRLDTMDLGQDIKDTILELQQENESKVEQKYSDVTVRCPKSLSFKNMEVRESSIEQPAKDTGKGIYENELY